MPIKDLPKASDATLKSAYQQPYTNPKEKKNHVHRQVIDLCNETLVITGITYPVINLTTLKGTKHDNVVNFLINGVRAAGIRPDTPFHDNTENRYPAANPHGFRYVEFNVIGGGMRVILDSHTSHVFLSSHYADPAVLTATDGTSESEDLADAITSLRTAHRHLVGHSDGTYFAAADRAFLKWIPKTDEKFREWLTNKNSRQPTQVLQEYGLR